MGMNRNPTSSKSQWGEKKEKHAWGKCRGMLLVVLQVALVAKRLFTS